MNWATIDRNTPFRYPQAIECPTCGALCATEEAAKKHAEWHSEYSISITYG